MEAMLLSATTTAGTGFSACYPLPNKANCRSLSSMSVIA